MKRKRQPRPQEESATLRDKIRQAADGMKERAKSMNSEEKILEQEEQTAQEQTETTEIDVAALKAELEKTKAQCDEYLDLAQRKQAEFANYRRRTEGVRAEAFDDGRREAIDKLLPVIDNLERALAAAGEEESALKNGVEMVLRQTKESFAKMGVEEIDPLGQPFDAEYHNAVMQGAEDEGEPGTVCAVFQKGYKLGNRVIRFAMVKVVAG